MSTDVSRIAHLFLSNAESSSGPLTVRALLAGHLDDSAAAVRRIAQHSARQLGSVGLLEFHPPQASLRLFATSEAAAQDRRKRTITGDAEHLSKALTELDRNTNLLLVSLDITNDVLLDQCQQVSVVASPDSSTMVAAYRQLKKLRSHRSDALGVSLVDCPSLAEGQRIAERFCQTTREFLEVPLRLDAIVLRNSRLRERKLAQVRSVDERALAEGISLLCRRDK